MARQSTNDVVERLRQRHAAELGAVRRVADAVERLAAASGALDVAVAASVAVFGGLERAAESVGMPVDAVRAAQGRAPSGAVRAVVAAGRGGRAGRGEAVERSPGGPAAGASEGPAAG